MKKYQPLLRLFLIAGLTLFRASAVQAESGAHQGGFEATEDALMEAFSVTGDYRKLLVNRVANELDKEKGYLARLRQFENMFRNYKADGPFVKTRINFKCAKDVMCLSTNVIQTVKGPLGFSAIYFKSPSTHQWLIWQFGDLGLAGEMQNFSTALFESEK